jgi:hypothetical protein
MGIGLFECSPWQEWFVMFFSQNIRFQKREIKSRLTSLVEWISAAAGGRDLFHREDGDDGRPEEQGASLRERRYQGESG